MDEMKNILKQKFIPVNYSRDLRSSFQDLRQGSRTIVEYSEEFMTMQVRCGLNEADDVLVDRYFHELRLIYCIYLHSKFLIMLDEIIQLRLCWGILDIAGPKPG